MSRAVKQKAIPTPFSYFDNDIYLEKYKSGSLS